MIVLALLLASAPAGRAVPGADLPTQREGGASAIDDAARLLGNALAGEPRIDEVQRAAAARAGPGKEEAASWQLRSRLAALVPRVVADYRHDDRSYRVVGLTSSSEVDYLRTSPGDALSVRLALDLDGLVFGRQELAAVTAARHAGEQRRQAVERATRLYYERLKLRLALLANPPPAGRERADRELELEGLTAQLDALTGLYGRGTP